MYTSPGKIIQAAEAVEDVVNNDSITIEQNEVAVMSGTLGIIEATTANQATVVICAQTANAGQDTKTIRSGVVYGVYVEPSTAVSAGDKLVSSGVTAGTAKIDNTETDPSKIIGYAWETKTTGGSREVVLCRTL